LEVEPAADDTVRRIIEHGDPVSVLLRIAQAEAADLIVVGSRGIGGHPGLLLGSTSTQVAQRADRPVVIVPHGDAEIAR
jgi:nucleotide-binding universal stress UspA family protein